MLRTTLSSLRSMTAAATLLAAAVCGMPSSSHADALSPSLTKGSSVRIAALGQLQCLSGDWDLAPGKDGCVTYQIYPSVKFSGRSMWVEVLFIASEQGGDGTFMMSSQSFRLGSSPPGTRVTSVNSQLPPVVVTCPGNSHQGVHLGDSGNMRNIILHGAGNGDDRRIGFTASIDFTYEVGTGMPFLMPGLLGPHGG